MQKDERIRYLKLETNGGIAANTNAALAAATGDWLTLLDHDDVLYPNALYRVAKEALAGADFVYSDEIVLSADLKHLVDYHFKPDFEPDYLRGCNYITHLAAFSRALFDRAGAASAASTTAARTLRSSCASPSTPKRYPTSPMCCISGAATPAAPPPAWRPSPTPRRRGRGPSTTT